VQWKWRRVRGGEWVKTARRSRSFSGNWQTNLQVGLEIRSTSWYKETRIYSRRDHNERQQSNAGRVCCSNTPAVSFSPGLRWPLLTELEIQRKKPRFWMLRVSCYKWLSYPDSSTCIHQLEFQMQKAVLSRELDVALLPKYSRRYGITSSNTTPDEKHNHRSKHPQIWESSTCRLLLHRVLGNYIQFSLCFRLALKSSEFD
jgi:hypothetical protein